MRPRILVEARKGWTPDSPELPVVGALVTNEGKIVGQGVHPMAVVGRLATAARLVDLRCRCTACGRTFAFEMEGSPREVRTLRQLTEAFGDCDVLELRQSWSVCEACREKSR
jgi:hypothetical protein